MAAHSKGCVWLVCQSSEPLGQAVNALCVHSTVVKSTHSFDTWMFWRTQHFEACIGFIAFWWSLIIWPSMPNLWNGSIWIERVHKVERIADKSSHGMVCPVSFRESLGLGFTASWHHPAQLAHQRRPSTALWVPKTLGFCWLRVIVLYLAVSSSVFILWDRFVFIGIWAFPVLAVLWSFGHLSPGSAESATLSFDLSAHFGFRDF